MTTRTTERAGTPRGRKRLGWLAALLLCCCSWAAAMDTGDVLLMVEAGVPETVVLQTLRAETAPLHPTVPELVALKRAGASERLLVWVAHPEGPAAAWAESELPAAEPDVHATVNGELVALDCGDGVTLVLAPIPAGTFVMGSPETEKDRVHDETRHQVWIGKPFYMGVYEVTQEQYQTVMGDNPSRFKDEIDSPRRPVEGVSWNDAVEFCRRLSERTGWTVRLPTEAEWEYACRAGTATAYFFGDTIGKEQANFGETYGGTAAVGCFPANGWGLHDMHGNVWEWCSDWIGAPYTAEAMIDPKGAANGELRATRGCSWLSKDCRSAARGGSEPDSANNLGNLGFRVVLDMDAWEPEVALPEGVPPIGPGQGWLAMVNRHAAAGCSIRVDRANRRLTFGGVDQPGATALPAGAMAILALDAGDYALWGELDKAIPVRVMEARATTMALEPFEMDGFEGMGVSVYDDDGTDNPPLLSSGILAARAKPQPVMAQSVSTVFIESPPVVVIVEPPPVMILEQYYVAQPRRSSWLPALAGFFLSREPAYRGPRHVSPPPRPPAPPVFASVPNRNIAPFRPAAPPARPAVPARPAQPPVQAAPGRPPVSQTPAPPARLTQPPTQATPGRPPVSQTPTPPARPTQPPTQTPPARPPASQGPSTPVRPAQPPVQVTTPQPATSTPAAPARPAQPPVQVTTPRPAAPTPAPPVRPPQPPVQVTTPRPAAPTPAPPARPTQPPVQTPPASTVRSPVHVTPTAPTRPAQPPAQATQPRPTAPIAAPVPAPQPVAPARPAQPPTQTTTPRPTVPVATPVPAPTPTAPARPAQPPAQATTPRPAAPTPATPARPAQPPVQATTPRPATPTPVAPARPVQPPAQTTPASTVRPPVHVTPAPPARPTPAAPARPAQPPAKVDAPSRSATPANAPRNAVPPEDEDKATPPGQRGRGR